MRSELAASHISRVSRFELHESRGQGDEWASGRHGLSGVVYLDVDVLRSVVACSRLAVARTAVAKYKFK